MPVDCEFTLLLGMTPLLSLLALVNIAQASAALGVYLLARRGTASVPRADAEGLRAIRQACGSCYMGVSEPVLFGVNAQHPAALQTGMVSSPCLRTCGGS